MGEYSSVFMVPTPRQCAGSSEGRFADFAFAAAGSVTPIRAGLLFAGNSSAFCRPAGFALAGTGFACQ